MAAPLPAPSQAPAPTTPPHVRAFVWLCAGALLFPSCKPQEDAWTHAGLPSHLQKKLERTQVALLADNLASPMRNYQCALLESLVRTRPGMGITRYNAGGDAALQARQLRNAITSGAKFLVIFPQDATSAAPLLREALKEGITVIALSSDIPEDAATVIISCDERRLGAMAGEFVVQALKTKATDEGSPAVVGRVVQLRGDEGAASASRAAGFAEALRKEPGVVLVHDAPAEWNADNAGARVREALRLQKTFQIVYAHNDLIAAGAAKSVRDTSVEVRESMLVMGSDAVPGSEGGVAQVVKGTLDATIYNPPLVDLAWQEIQLLLADDTYQPRKRQKVRPLLVTPANALAIQQQALPAPELE